MKRRKKKRIRLLGLLLAAVCLFFGSCAQKKYAEGYSCSELTSAVRTEILDSGTYSDYSAKDVEYMFDDDSIFDSYSIIYSSPSDDIRELGILHAPDSESAEALLEAADEYLLRLNEEKRSFLKNYLPYELEKLDSAEARRFGNYVCFAVLTPQERDQVFEHLASMLGD